ncbi:FAD-dependent monooxygenase [Rhizobium sp. PL01]|uniref:FAD-dependent monooxygenase n=1 Tax=Rhizobium sp. PL01 TaxID=3085631 RepID=UPI0029829F35|nr:FAD-dependent monooxygenase [Rhizobium sp. PL01]MDW5317069.1 FAD-dependent monooxygenase [Rhizobium sp. PL01]
MSTTVLIVGAGPVGLTMAIELTRYKIPVRIIDAAPKRTEKSKALAVWSRTLELLDRSGCAEKLVPAGLKTRAARIMDGKDTLARLPFDAIPSQFQYVLMIPQSETERVLEEHLASLGVTVDRNVAFVGLNDSGSEVTANLRHADGRIEEERASWLLGCDGAHSAVRHQLGLQFDGETISSNFVLADIHVSGLEVPNNEFPIFWHRHGIVAFFPISRGRYRVIADIGQTPRHDPTIEEVQAIVDERAAPGIKLSDANWLAGFGVNERMVKDFRKGRVFLAGDAAHIHSPAGGQGMNTGIQDAVNLAWKLAFVEKDGGNSERLLDSYSAERSANAAQVLKDSGYMLRIGLVANPIAQSARNFVLHHLFGLTAVQHTAAERLSELLVGYPDSPLNGEMNKELKLPRPGQRIEHDFPYGAGNSPRFAIHAHEDGEAKALVQRHAEIVETEVRAPLAGGGICVVRPDGYVATTARAGDWKTIGDYLAGVQHG